MSSGVATFADRCHPVRYALVCGNRRATCYGRFLISERRRVKPMNEKTKAPTIIKKYANRRLYNTASSTYVTLEDLSQMVQKGVVFVVQDAKTKEDLTRSVLTQIIVEEEQKGQNLLPISFLRQMIAFYGDSMRWMVPQYLETMTDWFTQNQDQMRKQFQSSLGVFPFGSIEEMGKKNIAMFDKAMRVFNPFVPTTPERGANGPADGTDTATAEPGQGDDALDELRRQLSAMQQQLDTLSRRRSE